MSMSLFSSRDGISKKSRSPTRCAENIPRRVFASAVMTRLYGRGAAGPVAPAARAVVSPAAGAPDGAAAVWRPLAAGCGVGVVEGGVLGEHAAAAAIAEMESRRMFMEWGWCS
ncbi:MAG: hypothetical protein ABIU76_12770, partial [Gemmatimonadaceae bacterium]